MLKPSVRAYTRVVASVAVVSLAGCGQGSHDVSDSKAPASIEAQIRGGLTPSVSVDYLCEGHEGEKVTAAFFNQTDPKSVLVSLNGREVIVLAAPSASGARYTGPDMEFWEHQGEVTITTSGLKLTCRKR
jgi:membrane-bound inhibitor of C-type lysozyme